MLLVLFAVFPLYTLYSADNIIVPKDQGKAYVRTNDGDLFPALIVYTTDGNGNVQPVFSTDGTFNVGTVTQGPANGGGAASWHVRDDNWQTDFDAWKSWANVTLSSRASEFTLSALNTKVTNTTGGAIKVDGSAFVQPVSVPGTIPVTGPLTDTELRATAIPVSGTFFQVTQPVSAASLPLPSGASTAANQTTEIGSLASIDTKLSSQSTAANQSTGNSSLSSIDGKLNSLGQKTMAASVPIAIASNQSAIPITGSITATNSANGPAGSAVPTDTTQVGGSDGTNLRALKVSATGVVSVDGSAVTQPISGTVAATQSGVFQTRTLDGNGNAITSQLSGAQRAADVGINVAGVQVDPRATRALSSGTDSVTVASTAITSIDAKTPALGQTAMAGSTPVVIAGDQTPIAVTGSFSASNTDAAPATQNVTARDVVSATATGANNQGLITGTPTAGSIATFSVASYDTARVSVSGTWTGTLAVEQSADGGTTWTSSGLHQTGTAFTTNNFTANFTGTMNVAGATNFRVRDTAAWTGTATVKVIFSVNPNSVYVANAIKIADSAAPGTQTTVKAASTASVAADTALVVAHHPSSPTPMPFLRQATGNITAVCTDANINACGAGSTLEIDSKGAGTVINQTNGTWSAVVVFDASYDEGTTWEMQSSIDISVNDLSDNLRYFVKWSQTRANDRWAINSAGTTKVRLRAATFTSGTINAILTATQPTFYQNNVLRTKNTYSSTTVGLATALTATDIYTITGSATKTVKINKIRISATRSTSTTNDVLLIKRSTANSGGTSTNEAEIPLDSQNSAASATVLSYTANPTLGTTVGTLRANKQFVNSLGSGPSDIVEWVWDLAGNSQPVTLRGINDVLAINLNGATITTPSYTIYCEWTEE